MGMYDYVKFEAPCWKCGEVIKELEWQSKDSACLLLTLSTDDVYNWYASCHSCGAWNEYIKEPAVPEKFTLVNKKGR